MWKRLAILTLTPFLAAGQSPPAAAARQWRSAHETAIVREFMDLLAMPNLARDADAIRKNAAAVAALMEKRGVKTRLLEIAGAPPAVYGEIPDSRRYPHGGVLCALRRAAARSQGMGDAPMAAGAARQAARSGRPSRPTARRRQDRSGVADLRPLRLRRQSAASSRS